MKLYELTENYRTLIEDRIDVDTGEIFDIDAESLQLRLDEIKDKIEDKAENIGLLILEQLAEFAVIDDEIKRLSRRKTAADNKITWLKAYLLQNMIDIGIDEVKKPLVKVAVRTNPPSVVITDITLIENKWHRVIPETWEVDKKGILEDYKSTSKVALGTEIITDKKRLEVK